MVWLFCLECKKLVRKLPESDQCPSCFRPFKSLGEISEHLVLNGRGQVQVHSLEYYCFFCNQLVVRLASEKQCWRCGAFFFPLEHISDALELLKDPMVIPKKGITPFKITEREVSEQDNCPICLDVFRLGFTVARMPCNRHIYHRKCISRWPKSCPVCKFETEH